MEFKLPQLPYEIDALEPYISKNTMEYHYGKHHQTYINNLNNLILNTEFENMSLEDIIKKSNGSIYNNAAQVYNHSFFWNCLAKNGGGEPTDKFKELLIKNDTDFTKFREEFTKKAIGLFGSGWVWTTIKNDKLEIIQASNAMNPLVENAIPLFVIDVWEHAYYLDYQNIRPKFIEAFWNIINWNFVNQNIK